jgi:UDP-N-acetylmuramoyl-tripeptide--D-alanyl-D-alanine ligase
LEPIPIAEAARVLGARVAGSPTGEARGVCTDTRQGVKDALFFALRGEKADGHQYVRQAFEGGAVGAVVEREVEGAGGPLLVVPDALAALGGLARRYRDRFPIPVIGVTGSVGKTSTREMIACALRSRLRLLVNEKNFNTEIGVPLTLFGLDRSHEAVVMEMAMRGAGQIARLAEIARPTLGVITNVGLSHIELLGSRDALAAAKGELLEALPPDGSAILNADDDYLDFLRPRCACRIVTFGIEKPADFRASDLRFSEDGAPRFRVNGQEIVLHAPGVHHVGNAAAACAVASALDIPLAAVAAALEKFRAPAMRMETLHGPNGITILNDAYNAAPDSMRAALQTLTLLAGGRRRAVAVLGDMKELGGFSHEAHRYVGELPETGNVGLLVTVGAAAEEIGRAAHPRLGAERLRAFPHTDSAAAALPALLQPGDIVLVKGSRAMEMEKIVQALREN